MKPQENLLLYSHTRTLSGVFTTVLNVLQFSACLKAAIFKQLQKIFGTSPSSKHILNRTVAKACLGLLCEPNPWSLWRKTALLQIWEPSQGWLLAASFHILSALCMSTHVWMCLLSVCRWSSARLSVCLLPSVYLPSLRLQVNTVPKPGSGCRCCSYRFKRCHLIMFLSTSYFFLNLRVTLEHTGKETRSIPPSYLGASRVFLPNNSLAYKPQAVRTAWLLQTFKKCVITSAKEVMFSSEFVCLLVSCI